MAGLYDSFVDLAQSMIEEYGQQITWNVISDDPTVQPVPYQPFLIFPKTSANQPLARLLANSNIVVGNVDAIMAAQDFTPTLLDTVVRNGKAYTLKTLNAVQPGDTVIVWTMEFND